MEETKKEIPENIVEESVKRIKTKSNMFKKN